MEWWFVGDNEAKEVAGFIWWGMKIEFVEDFDILTGQSLPWILIQDIGLGMVLPKSSM